MKKNIIRGFVIGACLGFTIILSLILTTPAQLEEVLFKEFDLMLKEDKVESVFIDLSEDSFKFETKDNKVLMTENPRYSEFKKDLLDKGVLVKEIKKSQIPNILLNLSISIIPMLIVFIFIRKTLTGQTSAVGATESKRIVEIPTTTFKDIAGSQESKEDMLNLINFLKKPEEYREMGAKLPKGVILYGPPGTGKTLTARAMAGEAGVPFFSANGSDFIEMYVGVGAKRIRELFKEARAAAPCIVFIDEIDAIGSKRTNGSNNSEATQTINALLAEMDGFKGDDSVMIVAATNRVESLDNALTRAGRFDRHISIDLPDKADRIKILSNYMKDKKVSSDVCLDEISTLTIGFSGAGLETLVNESRIHAVNRGSDKVTMEDIDESFYKILMKGNKKENRKERDKKEIELVAYHEAGHALCAKLLTDNSVPKVTIIPSTSGAGGVTFNIPKKEGLLTKAEILNNVKVLYAGRVSEYILTGNEEDITTGASQDIKQATQYIRSYFNDLGMSKEFGMIDLSGFDDKGAVLENSIKLSKRLYDETLELLSHNKDKLIEIANLLIEKETISEKDLNEILEKQEEMV